MKRVLAIGDVADSPDPSASPRSVAPAPTRVLTPSHDVREPAGPAVWVQQRDGSWAIRWRINDTWWDLSARYLQSGKRWREIFNFQSDAFHVRVSEPIAIYTTAIVAMPDEAVQRAKLLGEVPGGGGAQPSPSPKPRPSPSPSPGPDPLTPVTPSPIVLPTNEGSPVHWWILGALGLATVSAFGVVAYRAHGARQEQEEERA